MLNRLRITRTTDKGFTLIELLVVVIIIGILAGIAIPVFMNQKARAHAASVRSDLRNAALAAEEYFADGTYAQLVTRAGVDQPIGQVSMASPYGSDWERLGLPQFKATGRNYVTMYISSSPSASWKAAHREGEVCLVGFNREAPELAYQTGSAPRNYSKFLLWDSAVGGLTTVKAIAPMIAAGGDTACGGLVRMYIADGGTY